MVSLAVSGALRCGAFHAGTAVQSVARNQQNKSAASHKRLIFSVIKCKADVAKWQTQRT